MIVHWGRLNRGRRWHVLVDDGFSAMCDPGKLAVERNVSLPPEGGLACPRCAEEVRDLFNAMQAALRQQRRPEPDDELPLDTTASIH
jgi:hypothetical protein